MKTYFLLLCFLFSASFMRAQDVNPDSLELVKIYDALGGSSWIFNTNWTSPTSSIENWYGIMTDGMDNVTCIDLDGNPNCDGNTGLGNNNIVGEFPPGITFPYLKSLSLLDESISGPLPDMSNTPQLEYLQIRACQLDGNLTTLTNLPNLKHLDLMFNQFSDTIPNFQNMPITELNLSSNNLVGQIPNFNLDSVLRITISDNNLYSTVPDFQGCQNLTYLYIGGFYNDELVGLIPNFNLPNLVSLNLLGISTPQNVPEFTNLNSLLVLYIDGTLVGELPDFSTLPDLHEIALNNGNLIGTIPNFNLPNLLSLRLFDQDLTGIVPPFNNTSLIDINIRKNELDSLPDLSSLPLSTLRVSDNKFTFDDLLPNIGIPTLDYSPQDSVYRDTIIYTYFENNLLLDLEVDADVMSNNYSWFLNGEFLRMEEGINKLFIENFELSDAGVYTCHITNPLLPELTLYSHAIDIRIHDVVLNIDLLEEYNCHENGALKIVTQGGSGNFQYLWNTGSTDSLISDLIPGTYSVTVTDLAYPGIIMKDSFTIASPYIEVFDIGKDSFICDTFFELVVSNFDDASIIWSNGGADTSTIVTESGLYSVTVFDNTNNCEGTDSIFITFSELELHLIPDTLFCNDDTGDIYSMSHGGNDITYSWNTGITNSTLSDVENGIYSLTITDEHNCTATASTSFEFSSTPEIEYPELNYQCLEADAANAFLIFNTKLINYTLELDRSCDQSIDEVFNVENNTINFSISEKEDWCILVKDNEGCVKIEIRDTFLTTSEDCQIDCNPSDLIIPEAISPNQDGYNDNLFISGIDGFPNIQLTIFNRYGNIIFHQENYNNTSVWDGTHHGLLLPDGSYFYQLKLNNSCPALSGSILLIK